MYTKEFLVEVFISRYLKCRLLTIEQLCDMEDMANRFYDEVGRDKFRLYASVDAEAIRKFKAKVV